jgi:VWFA-related protein
MTRLMFFCLLICIPTAVAGQSAQEQSAATLRTFSSLVVVDVVVTDAHQNPVRHLMQTDFSVLEDGRLQAVKVFEEHADGEAAKLLREPKPSPGAFTNDLQVSNAGPLNIILLDKLNTPMEVQPYVHDQLLEYLKKPHNRTHTAIFGLTTQLRLLQSFTSDPEVIRAVLNGKKAGPRASVLVQNPVKGDAPGASDSVSDSTIGNTPGGQIAKAELEKFAAEMGNYALQSRIRYTLEGLKHLAIYLSQLPGRKNLIWFSGSFPVSILPDVNPKNPNPFSFAADYQREYRETVDLLARSQVAVYPVDARGVIVSHINDGTERFAGTGNGEQLASSQQIGDEHGTALRMAESTGGKAFFNTNNLTEAVLKATEAGSNYYTLAYSPSNQDWKGEFRKIQIKLGAGGLKAAYRRGYFADDPIAAATSGKSNPSIAEQAAYDPMQAVMIAGAPGTTGIHFDVNVRPNSADTDSVLAEGEESHREIKGPYRRYTVDYLVRTGDVQCDLTPDDFHHCALGILTYVYDSDGNLITSHGSSLNAEIPPILYPSIEHDGIPCTQEISVPVKGEYSFRMGIRDFKSGHVGALELPVSAVSKLPPLSAEDADSNSEDPPK